MKPVLLEVGEYLRTAGIALFWATVALLLVDLPPVAKFAVLTLFAIRATRHVIVHETIRVIRQVRTEIHTIVEPVDE